MLCLSNLDKLRGFSLQANYTDRATAACRRRRSYLNGKVAAPGLENRDYGRGDSLRWPRDTLYQLKLANLDNVYEINVIN
jgi:hypothetical protein